LATSDVSLRHRVSSRRPGSPGYARRLRRRAASRRFPGLGVLFVLSLAGPASAQIPTRTLQDTVGDVVVRRADADADGLVNPQLHRLPDLVSCSIGAWQPADPRENLFVGAFTCAGGFFRLDLVFDGLVNPPGALNCCGDYVFEPFRYGDHPIFGYVEIDMDSSVNTGGELEVPHLTYLGNAARFGGLPGEPRFAGRAAQDYTAFDGNIRTPPLVDRSGEEFHVAFHGWRITEILRSDESDSVFGPGEVWIVIGYLFQRAHGYIDFSFTGTAAGEVGKYEPLVQLQFAHSVAAQQTTVSLVYPLTNSAAATITGTDVVQNPDGDPSNQNSVLEALDDLVWGLTPAPPPDWLSDPNFAIIEDWGHFDLWPGENDVTQFLDPLDWNINVIVGTSYTAETNDAYFVWTDLMPNVAAGDFNGDGLITWADRALFNQFVIAGDGQPAVDEDGMVNCVVDVVQFGPNFSVFDVNYDGLVDGNDRPPLPPDSPAPGDFDQDKDVDQTDFGFLQACMTGAGKGPPAGGCGKADLDFDHDVDQDDFGIFQACSSGPAVQADPTCWEPPAPSCPDNSGGRDTH